MYDTTSSMPAWMLGKVRGGMSVLEVRPPMMCPSPMRLDIVQACGATDLTVSPNGRQSQPGYCKSAKGHQSARERKSQGQEHREQMNARAQEDKCSPGLASRGV